MSTIHSIMLQQTQKQARQLLADLKDPFKILLSAYSRFYFLVALHALEWALAVVYLVIFVKTPPISTIAISFCWLVYISKHHFTGIRRMEGEFFETYDKMLKNFSETQHYTPDNMASSFTVLALTFFKEVVSGLFGTFECFKIECKYFKKALIGYTLFWHVYLAFIIGSGHLLKYLEGLPK